MAAATMPLSYTLLNLSIELIVEILSHLPATDLFSIQRTCRTIHDIIVGTARLQYTLRIHIHGVSDFLPSDFPCSERLALLQWHEQSRKALRFKLFTECVINIPYPDDFIIRDGYLIYESLMESTPQYGYTDLCSGSLNEEPRWIHITMDMSRLPLPYKATFAPDHDLVVAISQQSDSQFQAASVRVNLTFLEFTTGALHPLPSIHTVSLPPLCGYYFTYASAEVLGDHILVLVQNPSNSMSFYLVSWKTGTIALITEAPPITTHATALQSGRFKPLIIEDTMFTLMMDAGNHLVVCELEISPPGPCLRTVCILELPPLSSGAYAVLSEILMEWVPTSKDHVRSRPSRRLHVPFYSSAVGTIALPLYYHSVSCDGHRSSHRFVMVISVQTLLSVIRTGVRYVPWVDWGPSSTNLFESSTPIEMAGPSWITNLSPLIVRDYGPMRMRYSEPTVETPSLQSQPLVFSTKVPGRYWESKSIETCLPYRDVVANDLDLSHFMRIMADREWIVGILEVDGGISVTVYHVD